MSDPKPAKPARPKRQGATRDETAAALGIARQTLWEHEQKKRVVLFADRSVDVEATRIRIETLKSSAGGKPPVDAPAPARLPAPDLDEATLKALRDAAADPNLTPMEVERRRKLAVMLLAERDSEIAAEKLARIRRESISRALAERLYVAVFVSAKTQIESLPDRAAPKLVNLADERVIADLLRGEVAAVLRGVSESPPEVADE